MINLTIPVKAITLKVCRLAHSSRRGVVIGVTKTAEFTVRRARWFAGVSPISKLMTVLGIGGFLLTIWQLQPSLEILPAQTTDPQDPLATRFNVMNHSNYRISDWHYACIVRPLVNGDSNYSFVHLDINRYPMLGRGAQSSMRCDVPVPGGDSFDRALLDVTVRYKVFYWWKEQTSGAIFFLLRDQKDGHVTWIPINSGLSASEAMTFTIGTPMPP